MYRTTSLDPQKLPLAKPLSDYKMIVSDLDHTLIDQEIAHNAALKALIVMFGEAVVDHFEHMYATLLEGHRKSLGEQWDAKEKYEALLSELALLQQSSLQAYGLRIWSREMWLFLAAKRTQQPLSKEQIKEGRDTYWSTFSAHSTIFDDAKLLLDEISRLGLPLVLFTGSDSVVRVNDDCSFTYDPALSLEYKMARIKKLPITYSDVIIGDPNDKPSQEYFDKLFAAIAHMGNFAPKDIVIIGDSPRADLEVPKQMGYTTVLIHRE